MASKARTKPGEHAFAEIAEARKLLDLACETLNRAVTASKRLIAIGETITARRLLDEARHAIDRVAPGPRAW